MSVEHNTIRNKRLAGNFQKHRDILAIERHGRDMDIDLKSTPLRKANPTDWRQVADITAEAFANDPVNRWIFGSPRAIKSAFRVLAREIYTKNGMCHLAGDSGAAMWTRHDADTSLSKMGMLKLAAGLTLHGTRGAIARATEAGEIMVQNHPTAPHIYLFTIGTTQSARGTGLGKALLAPVLSACDTDGMPVYLENSNPANTGFYTAYGFERMQVFACGKGGPPLEAMWRAPKSLI
jgi:ribosomal protein S18 acetylase RimI-like enzyme